MQNFKSGTYINQGYYSSFSPSLINRNWKIDEMQRVGLLVEVTGGKRGKVFLLQNYFQIFNKQVTYDK